MNLMKQIYTLIDGDVESNKYSRAYNVFSSSLIVVSVLLIVLQSYKEINNTFGWFIHATEGVVVVFFTFEYLLRLITSSYQYPDKNKALAIFLFVFSFMGLVDLLSILPFYAPLVFSGNLTFLRVLRLFRLLRIFKLLRYSDSLAMFGRAIKRVRSELISTLFITFIVLLLSANLMYVAENQAQPDSFANMGEALWWAVATLTTVGYGDVYPITGIGKILSGFMAIVGIGIVAIPTGLLSSSFMSEIEDKRNKNKSDKVCPKCGEDID